MKENFPLAGEKGNSRLAQGFTAQPGAYGLLG